MSDPELKIALEWLRKNARDYGLQDMGSEETLAKAFQTYSNWRVDVVTDRIAALSALTAAERKSMIK